MLNISFDAMRTQLDEFCKTNSGSHHANGLASMHNLLSKAFAPIADDIQSISLPEVPFITMSGELIWQTSSNALLIRKRAHLKNRVLLCGHMDTVFDADSPFQSTQLLTDNVLNGPGVADMKGGLIVMLHALMAFEQSEHADVLGWDVLINPDEEIGSTASRAVMCDIAKHCQTALVYEPSMTPDGKLAKNRKGNIKLTIIATGRSAHAGRDFDSGRNAICYLAKLVTAIDDLNHQRSGVTFNVGQISGGTTLNTVPDKAVAKIDIRITLPEDADWINAQLTQIKAQYHHQDFGLDLHLAYDRPPKRVDQSTIKLFERLSKMAQSIGVSLDWQDSGGCCDGNNIAQLGIPVLDTLGVRGGDIHTPNEYILLDSLVERASLSALLLMDLAEQVRTHHHDIST